MNNSFISIKGSEPELFDLCDIQVNDSTYTKCRYLKHDDGTVVWINKRCSILPEHVSHWRLNTLHSDEFTKEWIDTLKSLDQCPNINKEDWPTITYNPKV